MKTSTARRRFRAGPGRRLPLAGLFLARLALCAFLCLPAACGEDTPTKRVDLTRRVALTTPKSEAAVTYAYLPQFSHTVSYERHRRVLEYLSRETGYRFRQVFPATFDEHTQMVARGEIDISYSNPFIYIKLARSGTRAFARVVEQSGRPDFRGQIIVRRDNTAIRTLGDCRGKRWIAVDPDSAGGYLFALDYFLSHGIQRKDFAEIAFAPGPGGLQEKVILAVASGAYDVGSVRNGALELVADKVDLSRIRVLAETRSYPGWVYAARLGLDPEVRRRVGQALLKLRMDDPAQNAILLAARIQGVIPSSDSDFDPIRRLEQRTAAQAAP